MSEIKTEILINANAQKVWQVLTEFADYPSWNRFFSHIAGELKIGGKLAITISPPGGKPMNFTPNIIALNKDKELRWRGKFISRFLFQGEHYFLLDQLNEHEILFIHGEHFTGLLTPIFSWFGLLKETKQGFLQFNQAIKQKSESFCEVPNSI
ncbi:MAG: SRPBCC domain-containing protein [Legionellales bacterium]|nr:SRPBCC domain-containing protein [Legionellales bacterium]